MIEFSSNAQALSWIFVFGFWLVLLYLTYTMKGSRGKTIQLINILQAVFSVVIGVTFIPFSFLIGFTSMMVGIGTFVGLIINER